MSQSWPPTEPSSTKSLVRGTALERGGMECALVGPNRGRIAADRGGSLVGELKVQASLDSSDVNEFAGLVVPGGVWQADALRSLTSGVFVRAFASAEKLIAVIGPAVSLLIEAGLANERRIWRPFVADRSRQCRSRVRRSRRRSSWVRAQRALGAGVLRGPRGAPTGAPTSAERARKRNRVALGAAPTRRGRQ